MNRQTFIILILLAFNPLTLISQIEIISKDSAINIALRNGLDIGLAAEYKTKLIDDTIWVVKSLICDDYSQRTYFTKSINALNGQVIKDQNHTVVELWSNTGQRKIEITYIKFGNIDSLPIVEDNYSTKLTGLPYNAANPVFAPQDKYIAFEYGHKIGITSICGESFLNICEECRNPLWLNDKWLVYLKDNCLYKKNIETKEEIKITDIHYRLADYRISPDNNWIVYQSSEMWPREDSLGNPIFYSSINGQGINLSLVSIDGAVKKHFEKKREYYSDPCWTANSDTILFYISDQKYYATDFSKDEIPIFKYELLPNISLREYKKTINGTFPFRHNCQILEIDKNTLSPTRILLYERNRYRNERFSNNKDYLIYSKPNEFDKDSSLWLKQIK